MMQIMLWNVFVRHFQMLLRDYECFGYWGRVVAVNAGLGLP